VKTSTYSGKVAAVTGAASGMGRSLVIQLAAAGCEVAACDVDEVGLAETAKLSTGARVTTQRVDVSKNDQMKAWAEASVKAHGRVNLVFNNAGISYAATVQGFDDEDFKRVIDIDFWGVVHGTRSFMPHLTASGDGHVVNISSIFGIIGFPGQSAYNAAKFAVRGFTEALRIELEMTKAPVSATCVHPGGVKTNIARRTKVHASLSTLGVDLETATADFESQFRLTADEAAAIILSGVRKNARRVLVGWDARGIDLMQRLFPGSYHGLLARAGPRALKRQ
jgi:NAD(P)-dependent dehydrogenase (short-subunit alcohol dehydrogenase family)